MSEKQKPHLHHAKCGWLIKAYGTVPSPSQASDLAEVLVKAAEARCSPDAKTKAAYIKRWDSCQQPILSYYGINAGQFGRPHRVALTIGVFADSLTLVES
jgi:hypothetical protein